MINDNLTVFPQAPFYTIYSFLHFDSYLFNYSIYLCCSITHLGALPKNQEKNTHLGNAYYSCLRLTPHLFFLLKRTYFFVSCKNGIKLLREKSFKYYPKIWVFQSVAVVCCWQWLCLCVSVWHICHEHEAKGPFIIKSKPINQIHLSHFHERIELSS